MTIIFVFPLFLLIFFIIYLRIRSFYCEIKAMNQVAKSIKNRRKFFN